MRTLLHREVGQSVVELALVLTVLALILLAVLDFGRALQVYIALTNAAREGARQAVVAGSPQGATTAVLAEIHDNGLDPAQVSVTTTWQGSGGEVRVNVSYPFQTLSTGILPFKTITITSWATMMIR